ncbi:MAG: hypothetical protein WDO13_21015 [Verrucomicrobiota bacterium]
MATASARVVSLFGSIALYSVGALVVAFFCHSLEGFKVAGFFMGIGLAGELGGSVTLVLESLSTSMRTFGVMIVAAMGMLGVVLSGLLAEAFPWRSGYAIGGVMGLALLALRLQVHESLLFERMERTGVSRGKLAAAALALADAAALPLLHPHRRPGDLCPVFLQQLRAGAWPAAPPGRAS